MKLEFNRRRRLWGLRQQNPAVIHEISTLQRYPQLVICRLLDDCRRRRYSCRSCHHHLRRQYEELWGATFGFVVIKLYRQYNGEGGYGTAKHSNGTAECWLVWKSGLGRNTFLLFLQLRLGTLLKSRQRRGKPLFPLASKVAGMVTNAIRWIQSSDGFAGGQFDQ